jgi:hypothetical protein
MCKFKSALVLQSEEIIRSPYTESHEDLVDMSGLKDNGLSFVRIEFVPKNQEFGNVNAYQLKLDQQCAPEWWTYEVVERTTERMRDIIRGMIISENRNILIGGQYILANGKINKIVNSHIVTMRESSRVGEMSGASQVGVMRGSSQVGVMRESSRVGEMWGSSLVGEMSGASRIMNDLRINK